MLLSMTGIGRARHQDDQIQSTVEIRAVNNKFLKLNLRIPDALNGRESDIDTLVRKWLNRGTVTIHAQLTWVTQASPYSIDRETLGQYLEQSRQVSEHFHIHPPDSLVDFFPLPGVIADKSASLDDDGLEEWEVFRVALEQALDQLQGFRKVEGQAMAEVLSNLCDDIATEVNSVKERAPVVVDNYRSRLKERVNDWLSRQGVEVESHELLREVCIFSERCDISEEVARLDSHVSQFREFLAQKTSMGRKLDFLCQEMYRETNTIGSKANDIEISHRVVEMKATVEKIREIVQNIE